MKACKHLDYSDKYLESGCVVETCAPHFPDVRYWRRPDAVLDALGPLVRPQRFSSVVSGVAESMRSSPATAQARCPATKPRNRDHGT